MQEEKYLEVRISDSSKTVAVPVGTSDKPFIPEDIVVKWQAMVDILVDFAEATAGLILRAHPDMLAVLVSAGDSGSPFKKGFRISPGEGTYCEEVLGKNTPLLVVDVSKEKQWRKGSAAALGLISYYGLPLQWPDGDFFGSICLHDRKVNNFSGKVGRLMEVFKENIEKDLSVAYMNFHALKTVNKRMLNDVKRLETVERDLLRALEEKELLLDEVYFRIKNNLQLIAGLVDLQLQGSDPAVAEKLQELKNCIMSIKVVHDLLREGDDQSGLNLKMYLGSLVGFGGSLYSSGGSGISIDESMGNDIFLNMKQATHTGLVVNHVLADLAENGPQNGEKAGLTLTAAMDDDFLVISINGSGFYSSFGSGSRETTRRIVHSLADQLNGTCGYPSDGEILFYLRFPL